jgi:hypothetical protein
VPTARFSSTVEYRVLAPRLGASFTFVTVTETDRDTEIDPSDTTYSSHHNTTNAVTTNPSSSIPTRTARGPGQLPTAVNVNTLCASKLGGVNTDTTPEALTTSPAAAPVPHTDTDHDSTDPASGSVAVRDPMAVPAAVFSATVNAYL